MSIKLFVLKVLLYCPCNIWRHHSDTPCYISLPIQVICVFSLFISASLERGLLILLIVVQRTSFFLHWFFSIAFNYIDFCSLLFPFFWLLLVYFTLIFLVLEEKLRMLLWDFLFSKVSIYKFINFSFSCIPHVGWLCFHFHSVLCISCISFETSSLTYGLPRRALFHF